MKTKSFLTVFVVSVMLLLMMGSTVSAEGTEVGVVVTFRGNKFITFNETAPWAAPNGTTYNKGDKLPVWSHIEDTLNITIVDKTPKTGERGRVLFDAAAAKGFADAAVYQGDPRRISDAGIKGKFLALNNHFDSLPNFKAFLDANPSVKSQLTQADGNIYMAPYFDDINKLEKMFIMRADWVKKILDADAPAFDTAKTVAVAYQPVYDYAGGKKVNVGVGNAQTIAISSNIISTQNALAAKNGANLAQALRDYIDATYMNAQTGYAKRSDLFISEKAAYDADELVALMRAVKANPVYLTGEDKEIITYFQRDVKGYHAIRRIAEIFGVKGITRGNNSHLFVTEENNLQDVRLTDKFIKAYTSISQLYSEGLILKDYDKPLGEIKDFRNYCFKTNNGFMTHDYAASTVAKHDVISKEDLAKFGTIFEPVVPPATPWFTDEFIHYSENNRTIKSDGGWGIVSTASGDVLAAALKLVDYPFSAEGLEVMTFGPKGLYWNEYTTVAGNKVPKLIDKFYTDILANANGNWSTFMRGFVGSTLPCGHVKNTIAIETQISNTHYANGIERIAASAMKLASLSTDVAAEMRLAPALVPLTAADIKALKANTYQSYFSELETKIIKNGFGNAAAGTPSADAFIAELKAKGLDKMVEVYNSAFAKVK